MPVNSLNNLVETGSYEEAKKNKKGNSSLDQQDFLNLLITQMKNQDPLNPMDNNQMIQQTTAFSQLEQMIGIKTLAEKMMDMQKSVNDNPILEAAGVIGMSAEYKSNILNVTDKQNSDISFYSNRGKDVRVSIYDADNNLVDLRVLDRVDQGFNSFKWDAVNSNGQKLKNGSYYFVVEGKNDRNEPLVFDIVGSGKITAVKRINGKLCYEINGNYFPSDLIVAIKDSDSIKPEAKS